MSEDVSIKYAKFPQCNRIAAKMLTTADHWQLDFYDPDMLKQLGLPPDHNEKLGKQMEAELKQVKSAATTPPTPK